MKSTYTFLGSGATMYFGIGVKPSAVEVNNLATGLSLFKWNSGMLANPATAGGIYSQYATGTATTVAQTIAQGLALYEGGDVIVTPSSSWVVPPSLTSTLGADLKGGATRFTMDTKANATGHFNAAMASGAGAGSKIVLAWRDPVLGVQTWVDRITALASTGLTANQVTLSIGCPLATGTAADIVFIGPAYDLVNAPAGQVMPQGIKLYNTTYLTSAVMYQLVAWN